MEKLKYQRIKQFHENIQFRNNKTGFYSSLNSEDVYVIGETPEKKEKQKNFGRTYEVKMTHNKNAKW